MGSRRARSRRSSFSFPYESSSGAASANSAPRAPSFVIARESIRERQRSARLERLRGVVYAGPVNSRALFVLPLTWAAASHGCSANETLAPVTAEPVTLASADARVV